MGKIEIPWDLDGAQISAQESVSAMIGVIETKTIEHTGTFWTWKMRWVLDASLVRVAV